MSKTPSANLPSLGRIVLFCDPHHGDEQAAIITLVAAPIVNLTVFPPNQPPVPVRAVAFNLTDVPSKGTWRWPPHVS